MKTKVETLRILKKGKSKVLLHIPSSKVFRIDNLVEKIIKKLEQDEPEQKAIEVLSTRWPTPEVRKALKEIKKTDILEKESPFESLREPSFKSVSLFVTQTCNLRCVYCYASGGTYGQDGAKFMGIKTAKKAIDLLLKGVNKANGREMGVNFFGGEPLLNFPLIQKVVEYTREKCSKKGLKPSFSITTNGTLISEDIVRFLYRHKFLVVLSIDGPPEIHDKFRVFPDGTGSYHEIKKNLPTLLSKLGKRVNARATYMPGNANLWEIVNHLNKLEFKRVHVEKVNNLEDRKFIVPEHLKIIKKDYKFVLKKFAQSLNNSGNLIFSNFESLLRMIHLKTTKKYFCGAGRNFFVVSANGDIYPCQRFVGMSGWEMGSVQEGLKSEKVIQLFLNNHIYNKYQCKNCWARHFCGGQCPYENLTFSGNINDPDPFCCEAFKFLLREIIFLYASLPGQLREKFAPPKEIVKKLQEKSKC